MKALGQPRQLFSEKMEELNTMHARIVLALHDYYTEPLVRKDFVFTFEQLGLSPDRARVLYKKISRLLKNLQDPLDFIENDILAMLQKEFVGGKNLIQVLDEKLRGRANLIFSQIYPYLKDQPGRVLDFGCGDGQVTQLIKDRLGLLVEGFDVRHYPALGVNVPIRQFDGQHLPVDDNHYTAALLTNVLHHDPDNELALQELTRVVSDKLVVIETVPRSHESVEEDYVDFDRTFMNDYLYNRLFHNADVPVPGTFETAKNWPQRFAKYGWKLVKQEELGYDQPTIRDYHVLYVFEKEKDGIPTTQSDAAQRALGSI